MTLGDSLSIEAPVEAMISETLLSTALRATGRLRRTGQATFASPPHCLLLILMLSRNLVLHMLSRLLAISHTLLTGCSQAYLILGVIEYV